MFMVVSLSLLLFMRKSKHVNSTNMMNRRVFVHRTRL